MTLLVSAFKVYTNQTRYGHLYRFEGPSTYQAFSPAPLSVYVDAPNLTLFKVETNNITAEAIPKLRVDTPPVDSVKVNSQ